MSGSTGYEETYRGTLTAGTPEPGVCATVIVTRQGFGRAARVWLTLHGSIRGTAVLCDDQADELALMLTAARQARL